MVIYFHRRGSGGGEGELGGGVGGGVIWCYNDGQRRLHDVDMLRRTHGCAWIVELNELFCQNEAMEGAES